MIFKMTTYISYHYIKYKIVTIFSSKIQKSGVYLPFIHFIIYTINLN